MAQDEINQEEENSNSLEEQDSSERYSEYRSDDSNPEFYLSTDKSFGLNEKPYINLEGNGKETYTFRVYKVEDLEKFLKQKLEDRILKEKNTHPSFANPFQAFQNGLQIFKQDFRKIARKEFNSKNRSKVVKGLNISFDPPQTKNPANHPLLKEYKLVTTFSIQPNSNSWFYKRISIPVHENGAYLVEAFSESHLAYTIIIRSDFQFVSKLSDEEIFIYSAKKDNGEPVQNAAVKIFDPKSNLISSGSTNKNGIFHFKGKTPEKSLIILNKENQYVVSDPNFYSSRFLNKSENIVYLYTERPVYKPGDTIYFKGLVRNFKNNVFSNATGSGSIEISSSKGDVLVSGISVIVNPSNGSLSGEWQIPKDADLYLGIYNLNFYFNSKVYSTEFHIEDYIKPNFFVSVKSDKSLYLQKEKVNLKIQASYFSGKPLSAAKVEYQIFRQAKFNYSPVGRLETTEANLSINEKNLIGKKEIELAKETSLDSNGTLEVSFTPKKGNEDYTYTVLANVFYSNFNFSTSANFSVNRNAYSIKVEQTSHLVEPNSKAKFNFKLIPFDKTTNLAEFSNLNLNVSLLKRSFKNISSEAARDKIETKNIQTNKMAESSLELNVPEAGHYVLVVESKDKSGNATSSETSFWCSGKNDSIQVPIKDIKLISNKDIYSPNDIAEVLILSPIADATLLLSLEGSEIIKYETISLKGNSYKYQIPIKSNLSPNFTLSAVLFGNNEIYSGSAKILAPPEDKFIQVKMNTDKPEYKPGDLVELNIQTSDFKKIGVSTDISVSVVDEAIYQVQEEKNPPLISYFYQPRRANVSTVFSSSYKFYGYSAAKRLELALSKRPKEYNTALKEEENKQRDNFKDTAFWVANSKTDSNGNLKLSFKLPSNITKWRVRILASANGDQFGQNETKFISKKPVSIQANLPGFLYKSETHFVSATIQNDTNLEQDLTLSLNVENAKIISEKQKKIKLKPLSSSIQYFQIQTNSTDSVKFNFKLNGKESDQEIRTISLKDFGSEKTIAKKFIFKDEDKSLKADFQLNDSMKNPELVLYIESSSIDVIKNSLEYLVDYPYGCVEQTMSKFLPVLVASKLDGLEIKQKNELPAMLKQGLKSILKFYQKDSRGFSWYGGEESDTLMTAYVFRSLILTNQLTNKKNNYLMEEIQEGLLSKIETVEDDFTKVYVLFSLSENNFYNEEMTESIYKKLNKLNSYETALLGLIYSHSNKNFDKAKTLFIKAKEKYKSEVTKNLSGIKNDLVESLASILTLSVRLNNLDESEELAEKLIELREGNYWKNTRDTSMALLALAEKAKKFNELKRESEILIQWNNLEEKKFSFNLNNLSEPQKIKIPISIQNKNKLEITKLSTGKLNIQVLVNYLDSSKKQISTRNNLSLSRKIFKVKAESNLGTYKLSKTETNQFKTGDLIEVHLTGKSLVKDESYILVKDILVPGFSFVKNDGIYFSSENPIQYDSRNISSEKASFFFSNKSSDFEVKYYLRANSSGNFILPPSKAELMYYPKNFATTDSNEMRVE